MELITDNAIPMMESTSPAVAIVRRVIERRPRTETMIPIIAKGSPQMGKMAEITLTMPRISPAIAKRAPWYGAAAGTSYGTCAPGGG